MKRRTSCKSYLTARLETCWKYLQTMLLWGGINLDPVVERMQKIGNLSADALHCHCRQSHLHYCRWCNAAIKSQSAMTYLILFLSFLSSQLFVCLRSQHIAIQLTYPRRDLSRVFDSPDWSPICTFDNSPLWKFLDSFYLAPLMPDRTGANTKYLNERFLSY